jgi:MinD superfamily P-loop ATPase
MKVIVASGKGGTGKTTVCASLISVWDNSVIAADMDVEEPNLHLYLNPKIEKTKKASIEIPIIDKEKCAKCGACVEFCQFNALSLTNDQVISFPEMCHGCGGCFLVCPFDAIKVGKRELGEISWGKVNNHIDFIGGELRVGEAMSPPLIREVKKHLDNTFKKSKSIIMDAPPGTSCPAINAAIDADIIVLVAEPTPFGLYDLSLAREAFKVLKKPIGVVINRASSKTHNLLIYEYCKTKGLPVWSEIPFNRDIALICSKGQILALSLDEYRVLFVDLMNKIKSYV